MRCNLANWDRFLRFLISLIMLTYVFAGGPAWMYVGLFFLFTAAWGFDPIYAMLGIKTLKFRNKKQEVE
ncbi:MAG: DUF2892 domain-containing protein [Bdellovibrionia bacterium]